jgi:hypothetical protein
MLSVMVGVFIGALTVELLNTTNPGLVTGVKNKAKRAAGEFRAAFEEGYAGEQQA